MAPQGYQLIKYISLRIGPKPDPGSLNRDGHPKPDPGSLNIGMDILNLTLAH